MIEHGIHTTKADYWVHLFPLDARVYWYRVVHMREFLRINNTPLTIGKSKDGTPTGAGYLVGRDESFISYAGFPANYCDRYPWREMTDRQCGFAGEHIVDVLVEHKIVCFPAFRLKPLRSRDEQNDATDFKGSYFGEYCLEIKTERVQNTENLFVQSQEGGHRVHQLRRQDGSIDERFTRAPSFSEDEGER